MDKRKNNGGNSTKSKGIDKRKNEYRNALDVLTVDKLKEVLTMLHNKATKDNDTAAGKILLEWYLSKPVAKTDNHNTHTLDNFNIKDVLDFDKTK